MFGFVWKDVDTSPSFADYCPILHSYQGLCEEREKLPVHSRRKSSLQHFLRSLAFAGLLVREITKGVQVDLHGQQP